jgi:hypothetical protein
MHSWTCTKRKSKSESLSLLLQTARPIENCRYARHTQNIFMPVFHEYPSHFSTWTILKNVSLLPYAMSSSTSGSSAPSTLTLPDDEVSGDTVLQMMHSYNTDEELIRFARSTLQLQTKSITIPIGKHNMGVFRLLDAMLCGASHTNAQRYVASAIIVASRQHEPSMELRNLAKDWLYLFLWPSKCQSTLLGLLFLTLVESKNPLDPASQHILE